MCGCGESFEHLASRHPRVARALRPAHEAAMKHLPEGLRNIGHAQLRAVTAAMQRLKQTGRRVTP